MSKSLRSRMGAAVRKSSVVFTFANPSRPPSRSSSEIDATSVKSASKLDVSNLSTSPDHNGRPMVSPIPESPVIVMPSPEPGTSAPPKPFEETAPKVEEPVTQQPIEASSKSDAPSVHSNIVADSKPVTVGVSSDEPESQSTRGTDDRETQQPTAEVPSRPDPEESVALPEHLPNPHSPPPGAFTDSLFELPPAAVAQAPVYGESEPAPPEEETRVPTPPPVESVVISEAAPTAILPVIQSEATDAVQPAIMHDSPHSTSYLNLPEPEVKPTTPTEIQFQRSVEETALGANTSTTDHVETREVHEEPVHHADVVPHVDEHPPFENGHAHTEMPEPTHEYDDHTLLHQPVTILPVPEPAPYPAEEGYEHPPFWNSIATKSSHASMRQPPQDQDSHQPSDAHTLYDSEDPFADPVIPVAVVPSVQVPVMPQSEDHTSRPLNHAASSRSLAPSAPPTNERMPLLANRISPQPSTYSYLNGAAATAESPAIASSTPINKLQQLGWFEYDLPDGTRYFVHATYRIVTDLDLQDDRCLQAVNDHTELGIDYQGGKFQRRKEVEIWLRNISSNANNILLARSWVDHSKKRVTSVPPQVGEEEGANSAAAVGEDQLDIGYRYWSFVESHPAHMALPLTATREAMEALTWSYTDQLLPSDHGETTPFSMNECQELMSLLRSFEGTQDATSPSPVKTRVIARIHVRVAQWHQAHFRPYKPLPTDVSPNYIAKKQAGFRRKLTDTMISCLCFGIPYLLFHKAQRRMDEESRLIRLPSTGPVLVVGACTCLVAAVVLSASVTFLSLPGMDSIARIAAIVSILFSTSSMATSIMAIFRYKADVERAVAITRQIIGEGMLIDYRRSVALSLPIVFLVYAIIGFVTGIVLYSFRGVEVTNPLDIVRPFDQYTRWITVGVLGALAGLLSTVVISVGRH